MLTLRGKLHLAPIGRDKPIGRVLDAGTGTGVWAVDFGRWLVLSVIWSSVTTNMAC
jgi:hypothetical protein